jgi:PAS domain S-box-containing protein
LFSFSGFRDISIKRKLMFIIMLTSSTAVILACAAFIMNDLKNFRLSMEREVSILAEVIGSNSTAPLLFKDSASAEETLSALAAQPHVVYACIFGLDGEVVAKYSSSENANSFSSRPLQDNRIFYADNFMHMYKRIKFQGEFIGTVYLKYGLEEMELRTKQHLNIAFVILLVSLSVSFLLSSKLQSLISNPLLGLAEVASEVKNGKNYEIRAEKNGNDEIGILIDSFNEMLVQVQKRDAQLEMYAVQLEEKVQQRTSELRSANNDLKAEMEIRSLTEQALASEKERLAVTLRSIGDGVIVTDLGGIILLANRVSEELSGWQQDEIIGRQLSDVFLLSCADASGSRIDLINAVLKGGRTYQVDSEVVVNRTGKELVVSHTSSPVLDHEGQLIGVIIVFRDITEKQMVEEELLKNRKLESIGVLAGGIAHDFNNYLTSILGNISLAKMIAVKEDVIYKRLGEAEKACFRARDLTKQLVTYSKGGAPVRKLTALPPVLRDSAGFTLAGSNVKCHFDIASGLWFIEADAGQISQIVSNLLINACHAMPEGGVVGLSADNVVLSSQHFSLPPGRYVRFSVEDHGVGIPEEHLKQIFDPYFTTKKMGSGLGLATSYSIAQKHDGLITVKSTQSVGTVFEVYLPASHKNVFQEEDDDKFTDLQGKGRILLLDNDEMIRDVAGEMLRKIGYEVISVEDGAEAIAVYRKAKEEDRPFDAAIMDLTIPGGMGGGEAVRKLISFDANLKAIVSSGYSDDPILSEYTKWGFCGVIAKPYKIEELGRVLSEVTSASC